MRLNSLTSLPHERIGEALAEIADPVVTARLRLRGQLLKAAALPGVPEGLPEDLRQAIAELKTAVASLPAEQARLQQEWEAIFEESYPEDNGYETWARIAARLGIDANRILAKDWTPADLMPLLEGHLVRLQDLKGTSALAQVASQGGGELQNGPIAAGAWHHAGAAYNGMPPKPWGLAQCLHAAMPRGLEAEAIADEVEGTGNLATADNVKNWQRDANAFFRSKGIPLRITKSGNSFAMAQSAES